MPIAPPSQTKVPDQQEIEAALINIPHKEDAIRQALSTFEISDYFSKITIDEFVNGLF